MHAPYTVPSLASSVLLAWLEKRKEKSTSDGFDLKKSGNRRLPREEGYLA